MSGADRCEYIQICIGYRIISMVFSTLVYLLPTFQGQNQRNGWIAAGMLLSCMVGSVLYWQMQSYTRWIRATAAMELLANGIFIFLSGGCSSPYLWYYAGCLFIMIALQDSLLLSCAACCWCIASAVLGSLRLEGFDAFSFTEINIILGFLVVTAGFYLLLNFYKKVLQTTSRNLEMRRQLEGYIASKEQNRMAEEIHDTAIQKLFGMVCRLKMLEHQSLLDGQDSMSTELRALKDSAELTMKELRESIYGSRFADGQEDGVVSRLNQYLDEAGHLHNILIESSIDKLAEALTRDQKTAVYRMICEAVNNSVRHGHPSWIRVVLTESEKHPSDILVTIDDNGSGFRTSRPLPGFGNGLRNLREIATLLEGELTLENREEGGARIQFCFPR